MPVYRHGDIALVWDHSMPVGSRTTLGVAVHAARQSQHEQYCQHPCALLVSHNAQQQQHAASHVITSGPQGPADARSLGMCVGALTIEPHRAEAAQAEGQQAPGRWGAVDARPSAGLRQAGCGPASEPLPASHGRKVGEGCAEVQQQQAQLCGPACGEVSCERPLHGDWETCTHAQLQAAEMSKESTQNEVLPHAKYEPT